MDIKKVFVRWESLNRHKKESYEYVCECGGETLQIPHSDWCPKYENYRNNSNEDKDEFNSTV